MFSVDDLKPDIEFLNLNIKKEASDTDSDEETLDKLAGKKREKSNFDELYIKIEPIDTPTPIGEELPISFEPKCELEEKDDEEEIKNYQEELKGSDSSLQERTADKQVDPTQCEICYKKCKSKQGVSIHKVRVHLEKVIGESLDCPMCPKKYVLKKSLMSHLTSMHLKNRGEGRTYVCGDCGKNYASKNSLWMHRYENHVIHENCECVICNRKLKTPRTLRDHMLKIHPTHALGECDADVAVNKSRPYQCDVCSKRYTQKSVLKKHILIHRPLSEYIDCSLCEKRFKSNFLLESHMQTFHSNDDDIRACPICERIYKNKSSLKYHMRHNHKNEPVNGQPSANEEFIIP